jgi:hypothetical protein
MRVVCKYSEGGLLLLHWIGSSSLHLTIVFYYTPPDRPIAMPVSGKTPQNIVVSGRLFVSAIPRAKMEI